MRPPEVKERTTVTRTLRVGETLTLDNGRIVIELRERTGRTASRIRLDLASDVVLNKPNVVTAAAIARMGLVPESG